MNNSIGKTTIDSTDILSLLRQSPIFAHLKENELKEIAGAAYSLHFKEGETIARVGDEPDAFYIIRKGRVKIFMDSQSGKEFIIDVRCAGETFSDLAALDGQPHFASSQAIEETVILAIKREELLYFIGRNPMIASQIICIAGYKLRNSYSKLISLVSETVEQRLIRILLLLSSKYGNTLSFSRREIAEMIGTTIETSTRIVTQLRNLGVIRCNRGKISIVDSNKLRALLR